MSSVDKHEGRFFTKIFTKETLTEPMFLTETLNTTELSSQYTPKT
ncbi:MAG: hypothetical protein ACP5I7_00255 [Sulfolobales archaeon]